MSAISLSYFPVIIFSRAKLLTTEALANLGKSAIASTNGLTNATSLGNGAVVNTPRGRPACGLALLDCRRGGPLGGQKARAL